MGAKRKLAIQADADLLAHVREIAHSEGRSLRSVVEEALSDLVAAKERNEVRPEVMAHYEATVTEFGPLFERLARDGD
jgi:predicted transcriptional regulator